MSEAFHGRREDLRLVTGQGQYTADWNLPGQVYGYFRNEVLNAAGQNGRAASRQWQPGAAISGPAGALGSLSLFIESFRGRTQGDPTDFLLPTSNYSALSAPIARSLLDRFRAPFPNSRAVSAEVRLRPESTNERTYAMARADQRPRWWRHSTVAS